jgi:hypothetical protein
VANFVVIATNNLITLLRLRSVVHRIETLESKST